MSGLEFFASVICPIISTVAIVIGGAFALYKYRVSKNYEINLQILNEVYLPLYEYLVKQEVFRYLACPEFKWEDVPILEIRHTKTETRIDKDGISTSKSVEAVCGCTRESLLKVCDSANRGLASLELVNLLNAYQVVCHLSSEKNSPENRAKAAVLLHKVELALRKEVLKGYKYYHRKLKLHDNSSRLFKVNNDQIEVLGKIKQGDVDEVLKKIKDLENR